MEATGIYGSRLQLFEKKIRISREGWLGSFAHGLKGDKDILISQLSSIQFKRTGLFTNGYVQFVFQGSHESKGGLFDATKDENSIMFTKKQEPDFFSIKEEITRRMETTQGRDSSNLDELEKLDALRRRGIITDAEFEAKKKQLLGL
ncbi:MAG: SHOCT domain-containing protein [Chloroflexi bacterium]|nr:SHOCT domain-containing protein [Chloroflexota bacterium]